MKSKFLMLVIATMMMSGTSVDAATQDFKGENTGVLIKAANTFNELLPQTQQFNANNGDFGDPKFIKENFIPTSVSNVKISRDRTTLYILCEGTIGDLDSVDGLNGIKAIITERSCWNLSKVFRAIAKSTMLPRDRDINVYVEHLSLGVPEKTAGGISRLSIPLADIRHGVDVRQLAIDVMRAGTSFASL